MDPRLLALLVSAVLGVFWTVVALINGWWWIALLWVVPAAVWFGIAPGARTTVLAYLRGRT